MTDDTVVGMTLTPENVRTLNQASAYMLGLLQLSLIECRNLGIELAVIAGDPIPPEAIAELVALTKDAYEGTL